MDLGISQKIQKFQNIFLSLELEKNHKNKKEAKLHFILTYVILKHWDQ